VSENRLVAHS